MMLRLIKRVTRKANNVNRSCHTPRIIHDHFQAVELPGNVVLLAFTGKWETKQ
jgi:hypothetical protein